MSVLAKHNVAILSASCSSKEAQNTQPKKNWQKTQAQASAYATKRDSRAAWKLSRF